MFRPAVFALSFVLLASAQTPPPKSDSLGRSTPYGCVIGFLKAAAGNDTALATQYLDLRGARTPAQDLVAQLNAVLNRGLSSDLNSLSRTEEGNPADGLPANRERVGYVENPSGRTSVELIRIAQGDRPAIWLFSPETLQSIRDIVPSEPGENITKWLPAPLVNLRILSVPLWRWMAGLIEILLALGLTSVVTRGCLWALTPVLRRLTKGEDEGRFPTLRGPVRVLLLAAAFRAFAEISLSLIARKVWTDISFTLAVAGSTWLAGQFAGFVKELNFIRLQRTRETGKIALLSLFSRLFNILLVVIALAMLLQRAGVNLTAMLAGLGLGGVALALAGQKTLENLFGGISVIIRDIAHPGDFCVIAGQTGYVEDVGLGSTRLRTLDRTVVSIPNALLSQQNLENISRRDKFWFHQIFGLRFDTSAAQMNAILTGAEGILRDDSRVEEPGSRVRFIGFGQSSLTLEIFAYISAGDYLSFLRIQQELLLSILELIGSAGAVIASPAVITDWRPVPLDAAKDPARAPEGPALTEG